MTGSRILILGDAISIFAKRDKFEIATARAGKHGTPKGRIAAVNHFFYIFDDRVTRMLKINHFFKMVGKNLL